MTNRCNQFFTIQDSDGRYADKHSVNKTEGKWYYTTYPTTNAPLTLCKSEEEAEEIISNLEKNLHKVSHDLVKAFSIKQLT